MYKYFLNLVAANLGVKALAVESCKIPSPSVNSLFVAIPVMKRALLNYAS